MEIDSETAQEQLTNSDEELLYFCEMKKKRIEEIKKGFIRWKESRKYLKNEPTYMEVDIKLI